MLRRLKQFLGVGTLAVAVLLGGAAVRWPWLPSLLLERAPAVGDAQLTWTSSTSYRFRVPPQDGLFRIGAPPTPISLVKVVEAPSARVLLYYETLGSLLIVIVDRASGAEREISVPGSSLVYQALVDRRDPDQVWIAASLAPKLLSLDVKSGALREVSAFSGTHLFALDQTPAGELWVGSYPGPHCYKLTGEVVEEIRIDPQILGGRSYLHELYATELGILMHLGSPGRLVRYAPATESFELLMDSAQPFLGFASTATSVLLTSAEGARAFDRRGFEIPIDSVPGAVPSPTFGLRRPRAGGMAVNFLGAVGEPRIIVGGTYWNHWIFTIDPLERLVRGVGELPDGSGEIFSAAAQDGVVWLPSYQGDLFAVDPLANHLEKKLHVDRAHFGRATVMNRDSLIYATNPNYDQAGGMLIKVVPRTLETSIVDRLSGDTTLGALTLVGDRVLGGTMTARGLGLAATSRREVPRILAHSVKDLRAEGEVRCGEIFDDITGLVSDGAQALTAASARGQLFRVDLDPLRCRPVFDLRYLKQGIRQLIPRDTETLYVLTRSALFLYEPAKERLRLLTKLPFDAKFLAPAEDGTLYLGTRDSLYLLRLPALNASSPR